VPAQFPADPDALTGLVHEAFPKARSVSIRRASGGRVVVVYRAMVDDVKYYLRLAEEPGEDLTTDALVLERLRALGVRVPGVVAASPSTPAFPRSWMIMNEVPGCSIAQDGTVDEARQAAMAAGRDVAVINSVPVTGVRLASARRIRAADRRTAHLPRVRRIVLAQPLARPAE
jgi:aminoglycoside phosphotransferase (APT) family kinase protein